MVGCVALIIRPIRDRTGRHVSLASDDRLDPRFLRFLIKFNRAVKISVIGDRDRRHPELLRFFHQLLHPNRAIEEGVFGVQMEMNEGISGHRPKYKLRVASSKNSPAPRAKRLSASGWQKQNGYCTFRGR